MRKKTNHSRRSGYISESKFRRGWKISSAIASCIVLFGTISALTLPALTVSQPSCGMDEHQHTAECFAESQRLICSADSLAIHTHSDECRDEAGNLTCGQADFVVHTHESACYDATGVLVCTLPEVEVHQHTESCYTWIPDPTEGTASESTEPAGELVLTCEKPEVELHTHGGTCYIYEEQEGSEEQLKVLICTKPEVREHQHTEDCFQTEEVLVCQTPEHTHDDTCLSQEELTEEEQRQVEDVITIIDGLPLVAEIEAELARLEEAGDAEGLAAYREKIVSAVQSAFDAYNALTEAQKSAVTNAAKLQAYAYLIEEPTPPEETTLTAQGEGYTLSVTYGEEAALPESTTLQSRQLSPDLEDYSTHFAQLSQLLGGAYIENAWIYDISLQHEENEVQPAAPVTIHMELEQPHVMEAGHTYAVVHFAADGPEVLDVETLQADGQLKGFVHTQSGFSVTAYVEIDPNPNPADNGPDSLPVDYYVYIDGEWTLVGSTKTGWYGDYSLTSYTNLGRDRVSVEQVESILGPYGFVADTSQNLALKLLYRRKDTSNYNMHNDTTCYEDTISGHYVIPLARTARAGMGYNLYFVPTITTVTHTSLETFSIPDGSKFYTVSVLDANCLVYSAEEEAPATQAVQSGKTVSVTVKTYTSGWQWVGADGTVTAATGTDNGDGTTTYTTTVSQKLTLSPGNNNLEGVTASANKVYFVVWLDGAWTEVGSVDTIYYKEGLCQGSNDSKGNARWRWFVTSDQVYSILAPFGFDPATFEYVGGAMGSGSKTSDFLHQTAPASNESDLYCSGSCNLLSDGKTWAIGMSYDAKDYVLYYVPGFTGGYQGGDGKHSQNDFAATASNLDGSRFYSISVRDDNHLVYTTEDLAGTTAYVLEGGDAEFTVHYADGVLWSSTGQVVEPVQADNKTTFNFTNVQQKIEVVATAVDPGFTVQYYANIKRYVLGTSGDLNIIDTSGKVLPTNGKDPALKYLELEQTSTKTNQNNGTATYLHSVKTETKLTKLYTESAYRYQEYPGLKYFDKLYQQSNYTLNAVLVLKEGRSPDSTNENDWWWYMAKNSGTNITFTNLASAENAPKVEGTKQPNTGTYCILLQEGTVIRLLYESANHSYTNQAAFYDYDISRGMSGAYYTLKGTDDNLSTGINYAGNYQASSDGNSDWSIDGAGTRRKNGYLYWCENVYAFGNSNCYTGLGLATWNGNYLNKYNSDKFKGCTFGLVTGLNSSGNLVWDDQITAPYLFSDGTASGKTSYPKGSLTFNQVGDTYTLTAANSTVGSRSDLEYFFNPAPGSTIIYDGENNSNKSTIFTNNFWVVDNATNRKDGNWGKWGTNAANGTYVCDQQVYGWSNGANYIESEVTKNLPLSDDGKAHNWFFGMEFALTFSLTEDYVGPLEYIFFGDDDLWVFLDGQLICDIGGVHSSVGEYVNLRDYLPNGSSGQHTLKFFYTERGASGSTCWMSFTLPSVTASVTSQDTGSLCLEKSVQDMDGNDVNREFANKEYAFDVALKTSQNGSALPGTYSFTRVDRNNKTTYGTVHDGSTLTLRAGDKITISGLPTGTWYSITETEESRKYYSVTVNGGTGYVVSGSISTGKTAKASFVNKVMVELPATGGSGTLPYTLSGLTLIGTALTYSKTRKKRKGAK